MTIDIGEYIEELQSTDTSKQASIAYQKQLFETYVLRSSDNADKRTELWKEYQSGKPLGGLQGLRRKLAAFDIGYFGRAYLPHYFVRESPKFHEELDTIWTSGVMKSIDVNKDPLAVNRLPGVKRAIEAPRGHAKSTNFTFKDTLHAAVYGYKHYPIILSDSTEQAEGFLADIKNELEENTLLKEDFGNLQGKIWKTSVILLSNGTKIEAIGSGKKIRGRRHKNWRPDLLVLDDIENDENVNTAEQRKKLASWFYKAVSKAGDTYTDIVYIGTLLHFDSLLAKVAKNPSYHTSIYKGVIRFSERDDLWEAWRLIYCDLENPEREQDALAYFEANKEDMLAGTEVLWEAKLSYYDLMIIKVSEGDAAFNSEIQNEPIDPDNCLISEEMCEFYEDGSVDFSDSRFVFFGANDPSLGKNKKSDTSAIITLAKDTKSGYMYVVLASIERRHPDAIIQDAIDTSKRLKTEYHKGFNKFGVETVQFQYYFKDIMAQKSAAIGEYLPIEEIQSSTNKMARIQALQPYLKNGYLKLNRKHKTLLSQLFEFPMGKNDDGPDALAMVVQLAVTTKTTGRVDYKSVVTSKLRFKKGAY